MLFAKSILVAALASAKPCKPRAATSCGAVPAPTLPSTGATDVPVPDARLVLKKIALGHGIQNYTCTATNATAAVNGALAALYDITHLYPGTPSTGLCNITAFDGLSSTLLWTQKLPLNIPHTTAADPGTHERPNIQPEVNYGANVANPFPTPVDLQLGYINLPFVGVHYFDRTGAPTFDLTQRTGLLASLTKKDNVKAPADADKGILNTGAVDWLRLLDNGKGISTGISAVFRVVTAGGVAHPCSVSGAGTGSVPYTAQYWFYGTQECGPAIDGTL